MRVDLPHAASVDANAEDEDDTHVYVLTDPDVLNNHGMGELQTARGALALIERLSGKNGSVTFDVTLNGSRRDWSLFRTVLEPPFLAATLCVLGAAILLG